MMIKEIIDRIKDFLFGSKIHITDPRLSQPSHGGISRRAVLLSLHQGKQKKGK